MTDILSSSNRYADNTYKQRSQTNHQMTIQQIYDTSFKVNQDYGLEGYKPLQQYIDPIKQIKDRENYDLFKKKTSDIPKPPYVTKFPKFIDQVQKSSNVVLGPATYDISPKNQKEEIDRANRIKKSERQTYLSQIFSEQKLRPIPGPGRYDVVNINTMASNSKSTRALSTLTDKNSKRYRDTKFFYTDNNKFLSNDVPGPGSYNPHLVGDIKKKAAQRMSPKQWAKKHSEWEKNHSVSPFPDSATYKHIHALEYTTFDKIGDKVCPPQQINAKQKFFGSNERFKNPKKSKSKIQLDNPSPDKYNLQQVWGEPNNTRAPKTHIRSPNWMDNISKGQAKSIYYN